MNPVKSFARNLRALFRQDFPGRWQAQDERLDAAERRADERAAAYEAAVDARLDGRFAAIERHAAERAAAYEAAVDARLDERFAVIEGRIGERFAAIEQRLDERHASALAALDKQLAKALKSLDNRFDKRARALDLRVDDRLAQSERHIDQRFEALERRTDARLEAHERKVDGKIHQTSQDIVDRADLMLQIFEQRLDKLRRELRELRAAATATASGRPPGAGEAASGAAETRSGESGEAPPQLRAINAGNGAGAQPALDPPTQLQSFRKLAESAAPARLRLAPGDAPLYHQILAWKKTAPEGLNQFTPDEQETVDYLLSFISDPQELAYVRQHLRRFVATLQRIPPARKTSDRLLELGSLFHLTPAIKKYCGYGEICCADCWDAEEKVIHETLRQQNGPDTYSFELRNFDVERETFPYPDGHFRTVLCCELIEHLQSDPLHMLWECNRVLEMDGYLLLTTPNIASCRAIEGLLVGCTPYLLSQYNRSQRVDQHNREYAPYEVGVALSAAGFTVVELEAEDVWLRSNPAILELLRQVQISTELRGDNIFALARKTGAPVERYPKELYID
jgi:SAM-dependent methyltransferase